MNGTVVGLPWWLTLVAAAAVWALLRWSWLRVIRAIARYRQMRDLDWLRKQKAAIELEISRLDDQFRTEFPLAPSSSPERAFETFLWGVEDALSAGPGKKGYASLAPRLRKVLDRARKSLMVPEPSTQECEQFQRMAERWLRLKGVV